MNVMNTLMKPSVVRNEKSSAVSCLIANRPKSRMVFAGAPSASVGAATRTARPRATLRATAVASTSPAASPTAETAATSSSAAERPKRA